MTSIQWIKILILKPALYLPVLWQIVKIIKLKNNGIAERHYSSEAEAVLFEERAGWIFDGKDVEALYQALKRLPYEKRRGKMLDKDMPYSCSMRLIRLGYFIRMQAAARREKMTSEFSANAADDAQALASALECGRATLWFSNHLLQNYCALLLYHTHFAGHPDFVNISPAIAQAEAWLEKDWEVLFRGSLRLYEGSSSYEILLLPILCNIACCGYNSGLAKKIRRQFPLEANSIAKEYIIDGKIVMPHIGDITPDYPANVMAMFVETFAFKHNTLYRRLWHEELQAIGL